ncbi:ABCE1 [Cordylochernes scorpioides]|uniref:ABCE1 n=1 Tax=Cordylochernes scorpioides TaxID=51811 RepID=A0ABY6KZJ0_9ARAC|nr:ABCE1 [Cordylochernes scorpioides]
MEQKLKQRICIEFSGRISIEDDLRQGRPKFQRTDKNVQKIPDLIKENPRTTLLELEQDTGISKTTIGRIVTEDLKLKKTPAKFIPRFLTNEQKLCRLATCDDTWIYGYDPETKSQSAEWRGQDITHDRFRDHTREIASEIAHDRFRDHTGEIASGNTQERSHKRDRFREHTREIAQERSLQKSHNFTLQAVQRPLRTTTHVDLLSSGSMSRPYHWWGDMRDLPEEIAIVSNDKCKPKRCKQECKKTCPVVRMGKLCIEVTPNDKKSTISEELCIGCGICVKKCPFEAIAIINLSSNLEKDTTHRYSQNSFKLHRLPIPRPGEVLGLVGTNGIGKSTALKILSGKIKPNLGKFKDPPNWSEIRTYFRGSELQNYFVKILENNLKPIVKPQYVDQVPKAIKGCIGDLIDKKDDTNTKQDFYRMLDLENIKHRSVDELSGGELQRFAIAIVCVQRADIYMFDEPSSYLDVKQRLKAAEAIRSLIKPNKFIIVVEHDLSVLDYLSDFICCLYGTPGCYGVVTMPFSVREGINIFLDGFLPTENLRFRDTSLVFKVAETAKEEEIKRMCRYEYPKMKKTMGQFTLEVSSGTFTDSEIIVMLGENGTGKTTLIRLLAGRLKPDQESCQVPVLNISYKPQKISPKFQGTVRLLLHDKIRDSYVHPQFVADVMKPLQIENIMDQAVKNLSGGELQRVALALCLGQPADVYLIDEPSAYLDSEQRLVAAKVIKRFILHAKKTAFVVEHDFIMATYLADRVIVFEGLPSKATTANTPQTLLIGMNKFLALLNITFRRDPNNFRPRINKQRSVKDVDQKRSGNYFFLEV